MDQFEFVHSQNIKRYRNLLETSVDEAEGRGHSASHSGRAGGPRGLEQNSKREGSARGQSHGAMMNESNAEPAFEARQLKSAPGWYVRVAWSHGKHDHIPGFVSQQEALRWIETKARSWVSEQTRSSFRGVAA